MITFKEYQKFTNTTAIYPKQKGLEYLTLGLTSEAGEVAGVAKKFIRDDEYYHEMKAKMIKELGDVMWYMAQLMDHLQIEFEDVLEMNMDKLTQRKTNNTIGGSGDDR